MTSRSGVAVLCGRCEALLLAPFGAPVVRCGACGTPLRLGEHMQVVPPPAAELMRMMQERAARGNRAKGTSEAVLKSLRTFTADSAFEAQEITCPISADHIKAGEEVTQLPCGVREANKFVEKQFYIFQ